MFLPSCTGRLKNVEDGCGRRESEKWWHCLNHPRCIGNERHLWIGAMAVGKQPTIDDGPTTKKRPERRLCLHVNKTVCGSIIKLYCCNHSWIKRILTEIIPTYLQDENKDEIDSVIGKSISEFLLFLKSKVEMSILIEILGGFSIHESELKSLFLLLQDTSNQQVSYLSHSTKLNLVSNMVSHARITRPPFWSALLMCRMTCSKCSCRMEIGPLKIEIEVLILRFMPYAVSAEWIPWRVCTLAGLGSQWL